MNYRTNEDKLGCRDWSNHETRIYSIERVEVEPVTEPVTLDEIKAHLRITFNEDDTYLEMLAKACRASIEGFTALSLVPTNVTVHGDIYNGFELPYGPVVDVAAVITPEEIIPAVIQDGEVITPEVIIPETEVSPAILPTVSVNGEAIESTFIGTTFRKLMTSGSGLTITYRAGYSVCPPDLKLAILHEIAYQYENRGDVSNQKRLSPIAKGFAQKHRRVPKVL